MSDLTMLEVPPDQASKLRQKLQLSDLPSRRWISDNQTGQSPVSSDRLRQTMCRPFRAGSQLRSDYRGGEVRYKNRGSSRGSPLKISAKSKNKGLNTDS
ncbi:MAG: hypothetical protein CMJ62_04915 [Planctomycetaceae bacterium]|nr:hypothetical protein [Planctomycetaceae bacterium]